MVDLAVQMVAIQTGKLKPELEDIQVVDQERLVVVIQVVVLDSEMATIKVAQLEVGVVDTQSGLALEAVVIQVV